MDITIVNRGGKQVSENISINSLFDFFNNVNAWPPINGTDPPAGDNQQHVELNNLINAYYSKWNRICCQFYVYFYA